MLFDFDILFQAQQAYVANAQATAHAIAYTSGQAGPQAVAMASALYPSLTDYMGMEITQEMVNHNSLLAVVQVLVLCYSRCHSQKNVEL